MKTKRQRTRPLNPSHHWWRRLKKKETKTHLVWKCRKCNRVDKIERGPGWLKPPMAGCYKSHQTNLSAQVESATYEDRIAGTISTMKTYPSITAQTIGSIDMTVFDKLDGSNIRAEWSIKRGFYKFGSRKRMIDENDSHLGKAVTLIREKYEDDLAQAFKKAGRRSQLFHRGVVCFFEFFGPRSKHGQHEVDDEHDVVLFDISPNKAGLLPPKEFLKMVGHLDIAKVLYKGKIGPDFIKMVRLSRLEGMTFEGVVCKAANPNRRVTSQPLMFKIKSNAWLDSLRDKCDGDTKLFERLK